MTVLRPLIIKTRATLRFNVVSLIVHSFVHLTTNIFEIVLFSSEHMIRITDLKLSLGLWLFQTKVQNFQKAKCCIQISDHLIISLWYFKNVFQWAVLENIKRGTVVKTVQHPPLKSWGLRRKTMLQTDSAFFLICVIGDHGRNIRGISGLRRTTMLRTYGVDTYYGPLRVWKDFA